MLPGYFDYIFVYLRQKVRLRPKLNLKFLSILGPNPTQKARPNLQLWYKYYLAQENIEMLTAKGF